MLQSSVGGDNVSPTRRDDWAGLGLAAPLVLETWPASRTRSRCLRVCGLSPSESCVLTSKCEVHRTGSSSAGHTASNPFLRVANRQLRWCAPGQLVGSPLCKHAWLSPHDGAFVLRVVTVVLILHKHALLLMHLSRSRCHGKDWQREDGHPCCDGRSRHVHGAGGRRVLVSLRDPPHHVAC